MVKSQLDLAIIVGIWPNLANTVGFQSDLAKTAIDSTGMLPESRRKYFMTKIILHENKQSIN